jgi:hypothetical protein
MGACAADQASGQPMLIELHGAAPRLPGSFWTYVDEERDIEAPVTVVVESATYTNLKYLAFNVPF